MAVCFLQHLKLQKIKYLYCINQRLNRGHFVAGNRTIVQKGKVKQIKMSIAKHLIPKIKTVCFIQLSKLQKTKCFYFQRRQPLQQSLFHSVTQSVTDILLISSSFYFYQSQPDPASPSQSLSVPASPCQSHPVPVSLCQTLSPHRNVISFQFLQQSITKIIGHTQLLLSCLVHYAFILLIDLPSINEENFC